MKTDLGVLLLAAFTGGWFARLLVQDSLHCKVNNLHTVAPPPPPSRRLDNREPDSSRTVRHGARCSAAQADRIAAADPIQNSNCPDKSVWMAEYVWATRNNTDAVLVWIGCNRGDDLAEHMRVWSRNASFDTRRMEPKLRHHFHGQRSCPVDPIPVPPEEATLPARPARGFCIEAMTSTFESVKQIYSELGWDSAVEVIHAAASSVPGTASFPRHSAGFEAHGLGSAADAVDAVEVITVDQLSAKHRLESIDILSIDTEGNDMRVLFGAVHTLHAVRYLEFEYHNVNRWAHSDLQDLVDLLDQFGFDCFWGGNHGQLWRLTGCWHDSYYPKRFWSNIVCANREEKPLHNIMLKHADATSA